ncbi:MAG: transcriptional repressor [Nitrospirales bacterium]|nr:MAG: transcriptional repressor [Nitrospirales bacterium]
MNISSETIRQRFKDQGLKSTPQRTAIYKALMETTSHPTAEDLYQHVSQDYPMISQNTVYYTLGVLQQAGLLREVNVGHDRARYDGNLTPHHHLICHGCKSIVDVMDKKLNEISCPSGLPSGFRITDYQIEFRGYCQACRSNTA